MIDCSSLLVQRNCIFLIFKLGVELWELFGVCVCNFLINL